MKLQPIKLSFGIRVFGWLSSLSLEPFGSWTKLSLSVANGKSFMSTGWHFYIGPIHLWGFPIGNRGTIGFEIEVEKHRFRGEKMRIPYGMNQIFGNIPTESITVKGT